MEEGRENKKWGEEGGSGLIIAVVAWRITDVGGRKGRGGRISLPLGELGAPFAVEHKEFGPNGRKFHPTA